MVLFVDLAANCAPQVSAELLVAIASVESGLQPMMVRSKSATELVSSAGEGVAVTVARLDSGDDVSVGLMGLDARKLAAEGLTYAEAFDACRKLAAAGRVIDALLKAAEKMGLTASKAERHAVRAYFERSLAKAGTVGAYEAHVAAERLARRSGLNRLVIKEPGGQSKVGVNNRIAHSDVLNEVRRDVPREVNAKVSAEPVEVVASHTLALDNQGSAPPSGLVAFTK